MILPTALAVACLLGHATALSNPLTHSHISTPQRALKRSPTGPDPRDSALARRAFNPIVASGERWHGAPELPLPPTHGHAAGPSSRGSSAFQQHLDELDRLSSAPASPRGGGGLRAGARIKGFESHVQRIKAGRKKSGKVRTQRWN